MNEKALRSLEYTKVVKMLSDKAISTMGKELALALLPLKSIEDIRHLQNETQEAVSMILKKGSLPLGGIKDIAVFLARANLGGVLSIEELLHVADFIYVCKKVISYSKNDNKRDFFEILDEVFAMIQSAGQVEFEINRCILNATDVSDDATAALASIRRQIRSANDKVRDSLNSIIHSHSFKSMLQDSVVTVRNGRFCVPVKQEYRTSFQGLIHDQSSTGATLFIEPTSVVTLNNKIKELEIEEKKEVESILRYLSALVTEQHDILKTNLELLTQLDLIFAKGELSVSMFGTEPIFNTKGFINIKKGRHPLLPHNKCVPIDIWLGDKFSVLLITGPNTGGKTVSLKTLGLFTLMGQAGLQIPAGDKSELAVFDNVFADIGDEQSIEQNLSTFSSHMSNIVKIMEEVTIDSMVLLDELGAGTDPTEGAALAISIVKYLSDLKIRTAVTTHYSELKIFALATAGVENAACEFSLETLSPTYKLLIGVPGKSNAFAISRRLGLPEHLINGAQAVLSQENIKFEDIVSELEKDRKAASLEKERTEQIRRDAEKLKNDIEMQKEKLATQRDKLLKDARIEALKVLEEAKDEAAEIVKEMRRISQEPGSFKAIEEKRRELREKIYDTEKSVSRSAAPKRKTSKITAKLKIGDRVYIGSLDQFGTIISPADSSKEALVQIGIMKMKVKLTDLSLDENAKENEVRKIAAYETKHGVSKSLSISTEIDLRGLMVQEALESVDKYLDDASLSSLSQVSLIHGKGTGALRAAIHDHLRRHYHVKKYRLGKFGEGEDGVTIVEMK